MQHGMLVHRGFTSAIEFTGTHLYTWVERGTVRVKRLAQEYSTVSLTKARIESSALSSNVIEQLNNK